MRSADGRLAVRSEGNPDAEAEHPARDGLAPSEEGQPRWGWPAALGTAGILVSLLLAFELRRREHLAAHVALNSMLAEMAHESQVHMAEEIANVSEIAVEWSLEGTMSRQRWQAEAARLLDRYPYLQAVEWVDPDMYVRWISPFDCSEATLDLHLGLAPELQRALERSRTERRTFVTDPVHLGQGGRGLLVYTPIFVGERFDGFSVCVYRLDDLLEAITDGIGSGYELRIASSGQEIFARRLEDAPSDARWATHTVPVSNLEWSLSIAQGASLRESFLTELPFLVAYAGCLTAILTASLLHNGRLARWRTRMTLESNTRLRLEIHRRAQAEREGRAAHDELQRVMSLIPDHLWSLQFTADGRLGLCFHSPVVEQVTGRPPEFYLGGLEPWLSIVHAEDLDRVALEFAELRRGDRDRASMEFRIHRPDGRVLWIRDNIHVTRDEDGAVRLDGVVTDITDRKETEEREKQHATELAQVDRVNTMGRMASSIAHELTQPLFAIMNFAAACRRELKGHRPDQIGMLRDLDAIIEQGDRAGEIIRRLKDFIRLRQLERMPLDANELVRETMQFLRSDTRLHGVDLKLDFDESAPWADGDEVLIQQVVLNLAKNALEAVVERDGKLQQICIATERRAEGVEVVVADTGTGIADEDLEQMFQPFYTTKAEGLGMGLSICRSIVESHNGRLWAERNEEGGMTFRFTLPAAQFALEHEAS